MDDLSRLVGDRPTDNQKQAGHGRWKPVMLAALVPLGLVAVLFFVFREQLVRAVPVETGRVVLLEQQGAVSGPGAEEMLFQASGWVEPEPWPINLAAKVNGFVDQVLVKEGEAVTNRQVVARLDPTDARLVLQSAEAGVRSQEARLHAQKQAAVAARKQVDAARYSVEAVVARLEGERDISERYSTTSSSVIPRSEQVRIRQLVLELEAEEKAARAALSASEARAVEEESEIEVKQAALAAAVAKQEMARLALERTVIRSNMDGIVLRRYVNPGDKRVTTSDDSHSAVIATLYDPARLQVRVDVPIAEAGKLVVGQPARMVSALLPGQTFTGRVTRIIGQADRQRNTLQAKVAIDQPDERLRPEVLCRVEFWKASSETEGGIVSSGNHSLWIPSDALLSEAREQQVWVVDPLTQTVHRRNIVLSSARHEGLRQIVEGLRANEVVVIEGQAAFKEGARVKEVGQ